MPEKRVLKVRHVMLFRQPSGRINAHFNLAEDDHERGWFAGTRLFSSAIVSASFDQPALIETENTRYEIVG